MGALITLAAAVTQALITACAPGVAPETIEAIIRVESGGNPHAVNVNGSPLARQPRTARSAAETAKAAIEAGFSVDLGLMQINSENLPSLGLSVEEVLDPCLNIEAGTRILRQFYRRAASMYGPGQAALQAALSGYNTGSLEDGFENGYVARYFGTESANSESVRQAEAAPEEDPHAAPTEILFEGADADDEHPPDSNVAGDKRAKKPSIFGRTKER